MRVRGEVEASSLVAHLLCSRGWLGFFHYKNHILKFRFCALPSTPEAAWDRVVTGLVQLVLQRCSTPSEACFLSVTQHHRGHFGFSFWKDQLFPPAPTSYTQSLTDTITLRTHGHTHTHTSPAAPEEHNSSLFTRGFHGGVSYVEVLQMSCSNLTIFVAFIFSSLNILCVGWRGAVFLVPMRTVLFIE